MFWYWRVDKRNFSKSHRPSSGHDGVFSETLFFFFFCLRSMTISLYLIAVNFPGSQPGVGCNYLTVLITWTRIALFSAFRHGPSVSRFFFVESAQCLRNESWCFWFTDNFGPRNDNLCFQKFGSYEIRDIKNLFPHRLYSSVLAP